LDCCWQGKLTWDTSIAAIKASISAEYTRQALFKHKQFADAFTLKKAAFARNAARLPSRNGRVNALNTAITGGGLNCQVPQDRKPSFEKDEDGTVASF
jgi:hypothetical protein